MEESKKGRSPSLRMICMDAPEDMVDDNGRKPERLYMYAPNCWSANPCVAIHFHVDGAARGFGDMCGCHEGDYIWDAFEEKVVYEWGKGGTNE